MERKSDIEYIIRQPIFREYTDYIVISTNINKGIECAIFEVLKNSQRMCMASKEYIFALFSISRENGSDVVILLLMASY